MKKLVMYIILLAIIISLGIFIGLNLEDDKRTVPTTSLKTENKVENTLENKVENTVINKVEKNEIKDTEKEESKETGIPDKIAEPETKLEQAIEIAKKAWGDDNSVYFAEDGQTKEGDYIICVRDNNTTSALAWYKVNIEDGTCEEW